MNFFCKYFDHVFIDAKHPFYKQEYCCRCGIKTRWYYIDKNDFSKGSFRRIETEDTEVID